MKKTKFQFILENRIVKLGLLVFCIGFILKFMTLVSGTFNIPFIEYILCIGVVILVVGIKTAVEKYQAIEKE